MGIQTGQQENTFSKGANQDTSLQEMPFDMYFEGNDVCINPNRKSTKLSITTNDGTTKAFNLGGVAVQNEVVRVYLDTTEPNIVHQFSITDSLGNVISVAPILSGSPSQSARFTDLKAQFESVVEAAVPGVAITTSDYPFSFSYFQATISGISASLYFTEEVLGITQTLIVLQEKISPTQLGSFMGCAGLNMGDDLFLLSTNGSVTQISVAVKDQITGVWTHTPLLQSAQIPLLISNVTFLKGEKSNGTVRLYWVDGNDAPRSFYVKDQAVWTPFSAMIYTTSTGIDGNPDGFYTYGDTGSQTKQQIFNNTVHVEDIRINDSDGVFTSGMKRFAVRMVDASANSNFGVLSDPIPIPIRSLGTIFGGGGYTPPQTSTQTQATGQPTSKSVTLTLAGIKNTVYKEYEIGVVEYIGSAISSFVLGPFPVLGETFDVTISGDENKRSLSLTEFQAFAPVIKAAHLNEIQKNKYFLGRITLAQDPDLSDWVENTLFAPSNLETLIKELPAQGRLVSVTNSEYNNPYNVYKYAGHMVNETYRYGIKFFLTNGIITAPYFGVDYKFISGTNLTDALGSGIDPTVIYVRYLNLKTIDLSTAPSIDGVPFIDMVEGFQIVRCACIPEVLATGYALLGDIRVNDTPFTRTTGTTRGFAALSEDYSPPYAYTTGSPIVEFEKRRVGNFISQDVSTGQVSIDFRQGDSFMNTGYPQYSYYNEHTTKDAPFNIECFLHEYPGVFSGNNTYNEFGIVSANPISWNNIAQLSGSAFAEYISAYASTTFDGGPESGTITNASNGVAFVCFQPLIAVSAIAPTGATYVQYFRQRDNKYGQKNRGNYLSLGTFVKCGGNKGFVFTDVAMFSGDTFTQKSFHKLIYNCAIDGITNHSAGAVSYYSQNRINSQYKNAIGLDPNSASLVYPLNTDSVTDWEALASNLPEQFLFDQGYAPQDGVREAPAYNSDTITVSDQDTTVYWSDERLDQDTADAYRTIRIGNSKTYQATDGALTGMWRIGESLLILQPNSVKNQPVDPNVLISGQDVAQLIIGTGSVLGTQANVIGKVGPTLKSESLRIVNERGNENAWWYNHNTNQQFRYGGNGVEVISDKKFWQSFMLENNRYVIREKDIIFGHDPFYDEILMIASVSDNGSVQWNAGSTYNPGDRIWKSYAGIKIGFVAKRTVPINKDPGTIENQFQYWDYDPQSRYNVVYNEWFDCYNGTYLFRPNLCVTYKNTFLSFIDNYRPDGTYYYFFEHHTNPDCVYYDLLPGNPFVSIAFNKTPKIFKQLLKFFIDSKEKPLRIEVFNDLDGTKTYITADQIDKYRNRFRATSKFDATISATNASGSNLQPGTKKMKSELMKVKIFLVKDIFLNSFVSTYIEKFKKYFN